MMAPRGAGGAMGYNTMNDSYNGSNGINWGGLAGKAAAGALVFGVGATAHNRMKGASGMYANGSNFLGEAWRNAKAPLSGNGWNAMRTQRAPLGSSLKRSKFKGLYGLSRGSSFRPNNSGTSQSMSRSIHATPGGNVGDSGGLARDLAPTAYTSEAMEVGALDYPKLPATRIKIGGGGGRSPSSLGGNLQTTGPSRINLTGTNVPSDPVIGRSPFTMAAPPIDPGSYYLGSPISHMKTRKSPVIKGSPQSKLVTSLNHRRVNSINDQALKRRLPSMPKIPNARSGIKAMRGVRPGGTDRSIGGQAMHFFGAGDFAGKGAMRGGVGAMRIGGAIGAVGLGIYGAMAAKDFIFG